MPPEPGITVLNITNIGTMACYTYDSTTHSCTNTTTGWQDPNANLLTAPSVLETFTIPTNGKYKVNIKAEVGSPDLAASSSSSRIFSANGGIINFEKVYFANTRLMFKVIPGGFIPHAPARCWGGAGVATYDNDSLRLVAGGGGVAGCGGGGGYVGGRCRRVVSGSEATWAMNGYGIDGTNTTYSTTLCTSSSCPSGAYGGGYERSSGSDQHWVYGGSSYVGSDYSSLGIFTPGGNATNAPQGYSAASYGNSDSGSVTITYCGPDANSTCP